jgi:phospholipase/carboxylesterase
MLHFLRQPATQPIRRTLVFMHGLGDSEQGWTFLQQALELPWLEVVLVRAPEPYFGGYSWYDINTPERVAPDIAVSRQKLSELLDHLAIPREQLLLGGFSQGAVMAAEMTLRANESWAGSLCISGYVPLWRDYPANFGSGWKGQRILATHGPWDTVLPLDMARKQWGHLQEQGVELSFETFDKGHDLNMEEELPRLRQFLSEGV